jgi:hypothetical protein
VNEFYRRQGVVIPSCLSRNPLTKSLASTLAAGNEIYRIWGDWILSYLSMNLLTEPLASTLAAVNKFFRGYDVPIPFCLSRKL